MIVHVAEFSAATNPSDPKKADIAVRMEDELGNPAEGVGLVVAVVGVNHTDEGFGGYTDAAGVVSATTVNRLGKSLTATIQSVEAPAGSTYDAAANTASTSLTHTL